MKTVISLFLIGFCVVQAVQAQGKTGQKFGDWVVAESVDSMTDKRSCLVVNGKRPDVIYSEKDAFKIGSQRLGVVTAFRYRFGKYRPSEMELVPTGERVAITVPVFVAEALDAPTLRVSGTAVLTPAFEIEISLKGLAQARAAMAKRCGLDPLPQMSNAPDWARWQALPIEQN